MIDIAVESKLPLYQQIYTQLKQQIVTGVLKVGTRLTSTRELAKNLCVARNTVENAYAQLCLEGYVLNKAGSGFIVLDICGDKLPSLCLPTTGATIRSSQKTARRGDIFADADAAATCRYDFQYGNLSHTSFPSAIWRRLTADALSSFEAQKISFYGDKQGELELRTAIMTYLLESRGVRCLPEQIVLCCGTQYALDVICHLTSECGRQIAVEDPGYDGARIVFQNNGYEIVPVSVGAEGINLDELEHSPAKLVYITPSHQFPTGAVMPIHNRLQLLQWAEARDGIIIEDDYDSEFRYHTRPIPALQSIDADDRVVYLGTFSKSLSPGLRISYIILPMRLLARYNSIYAGYYSTIPWLQQKIVSLYMARGHWERHLRKVCLQNKKRHDITIKAITECFGNRLKIHGNNAGLHLLLEFTMGETEKWLIEKAKNYGVRVYPTEPFWLKKEACPGNIILLGFSMLSEEDIVAGITLLKKTWSEDEPESKRPKTTLLRSNFHLIQN